MSQTSGLTVRQHEREGIAVPVEFVVCEEHRSQVHFSPASPALGQYAISGRAVDISSGGMGLEVRQFIPRMCEGVVRVIVPQTVEYVGEGSPAYDIAFEQRAKVRRIYLVGREPMYTVGLAFVSPGPEIDAQITALMARVKQMGQQMARKTELTGNGAPINPHKGGGATHA